MKRLFNSTFVTTPLLVVVAVALWSAYVRAFEVSDLIIPGPEKVFRRLGTLLTQPETYTHLRVTVSEILIGFVIATLVGVVLGTVVAKVRVLERLLTPFIVATQVTPKTPFIPLFIIWFGFGMSSKVVIAALLAFFPVFTNTLFGIKAAPIGLRDVMTVLQAGRLTRFFRMELPHATPNILSGMEVGIVLAVIGAIVGEFLAGNQGLGYLTVYAMNTFQVDMLFAVICVLTSLGFLMHLGIIGLRRWMIPWHESEIVDAG